MRPSSNASVPGFTRLGGLLTSVTMIVTPCVALALGMPLSVTRTTMLFVLGPCDSSGVQVKNPLTGSILAPAGAPGSRLKLKLWTGRSESEAVAVKLTVVFSARLRDPSGVTVGGLFTLLTVTLKVLLSVNGGEPLSQTRMVRQ